MPKAEKAPKEPKAAKAPKEKKAKDPNAPKKALSAYMLFSSAKRPEVKAKNPDASFGDLGKLLGEAWKNASASEKTKFEDEAKKDKERYAKEMAAYGK